MQSSIASLVESTRMYSEIGEASAAIADQIKTNGVIIESLARSLREQPPRLIATGARGSSDNAATFAKYLFETRIGVTTTSAAPSVQSVYAATQDLDGALFLAISQSGKSPDLVDQARAAKTAGARVVALVNVVESPLAEVADFVIPMHAGPEISVAATKSFLCTISALLHLAAVWSGDAGLRRALESIPSSLDANLGEDWSSLVDGLADAQNLFVVGRGIGLAAAQEIALKLKETCGLHAEAFSAAEVQHGPMVLVDQGFPVLFFVQDDGSREGTLDVARKFHARGARVWIAGEHQGPGALPLSANIDPVSTPLLAVHRCYLAINELSIRRGRNPDAPPHLKKVTETV
jgi:glutamine---fructose-6-phosphate transaminase (isomerizing)